MVQYLLTCKCGRKTPVDTLKAGQTLECECGAKLEVPTLGGLKKLPVVQQEKRPTKPKKWGGRQQVLFIGALIFIVGLGIAGAFSLKRPVPPPHQNRIEIIPQYVEDISLLETIRIWGTLEQGLPDGLGLEDQAYLNANQAYLRRTGVALAIAAIGALVMIISLFIPQKNHTKKQRRKIPS